MCYIAVRIGKKGRKRRSWLFRMRCPVVCGCALAPTPPPRLWFWMPLSPLTCSTASTPATLTLSASPVCQVGPVVTLCVCWGKNSFSYWVICGVLSGVLETDYPAGEAVPQDLESSQGDAASLAGSVASVGSAGSDSASAAEGTTAIPQTASAGVADQPAEHSATSASGSSLLKKMFR